MSEKYECDNCKIIIDTPYEIGIYKKGRIPLKYFRHLCEKCYKQQKWMEIK